VLTPKGRLVLVGGPSNRVVGPLGHVAAVRLASMAGRRSSVFFIASFNRPDLDTLREWLDDGAVRPVIEQRYELDDIADALAQVGRGHVRGKLVVSL
jgi:NADPH:quinone reductase-like Zn-dependent oxidoreductase